LAGRLFEQALPALTARGVRRFVLEVLQENTAAVKAYEKTGFHITRSFACFEQGDGLANTRHHLDIHPVDAAVLAEFETELDWPPSWENSFDAIRTIAGDVRLIGAFEHGQCQGIAGYLPALRWIVTLVVRRSCRGRGLGGALLREALAQATPAGRPVRINNVDASDLGMLRFLARAGFREFTSQYEMVRHLF
jgi:ribosomal protein S18 acetylase RimI-like enzyme